MKWISLTRGHFAVVDDEDFNNLMRFRWHANCFSGKWYAFRKHNYQKISMHRQIMSAPKGMDVDHINGNTLDNRKSNLRNCTHSQNMANRGVTKQNKSGFKGVSFHKQHQKWHAKITVMRKKIHIGYFETPEDAASAYDAKAKEFFGEFARLNFKTKK